jgi:hypothetical protein
MVVFSWETCSTASVLLSTLIEVSLFLTLIEGKETSRTKDQEFWQMDVEYKQKVRYSVCFCVFGGGDLLSRKYRLRSSNHQSNIDRYKPCRRLDVFDA